MGIPLGSKGTPRYLNTIPLYIEHTSTLIYSYIRHKTPRPRVNPTVWIYRVGGGNGLCLI